jgi:ABC-type transport system involved in multi-copper enzyme maturation permease subunit
MRQAIQIFRKDFRSYFVSPIAYIVIAIFLLVTGWFFFATFFLFGQANLRNFFFTAADYLFLRHSGYYHAPGVRRIKHRLI